jgi:hypothetical protein
MRCTIKELADELGVSVSSVKRELRGSEFATAQRAYESADTALDGDEAAYIRDAHARGRLDRERGKQRDVEKKPEPTARVIKCSAHAGLMPPPRTDGGPQYFRSARHRLFVHQELLEELSDKGCTPSIRRALTHRARQLMTHGRTTRSKGVRGRNAGWTRVPLGGNSGFH